MNFKSKEEYKPGDTLISHGDIQMKIHKIASTIAADFNGKNVLVIGVMKGSFMVMADLIRALHEAGLHDLTVAAVTVGSYGSETVSSKKPKLKHEIDIDIKGRNILLIEDIVDTGHTLQFIIDELLARGVLSVKTFSLLSKPSRREIKIEADYIGFIIPNVWVQGYGLDTDEWGRGNPDIIIGPVVG